MGFGVCPISTTPFPRQPTRPPDRRLPMSDRPAAANGQELAAVRPPRLPRWTRQEILVLIEGKRVVESRGKGRALSRAGLVGHSSPVEPKWASVSTYCRRHGVNRGAVQCRKRWSNLAGDYKKIKEWETNRGGGGGAHESFWVMRNDLRRERKLPGFFDREVYDILDGAAAAVEREEEEAEEEMMKDDEEAVFDSGRTAAEDGLFSDFEGEEEDAAAATATAAGVEEAEMPMPAVVALEAVRPISEKKFDTSQQDCSDSGMPKDKQPAENPEKGPASSQEGHKRRRMSQDGYADTSLQNQLIEVLERNSRMLTAQLEAQNVNNQLDREQRKDQTDGLLSVLSKVADALGKIADKL